jgi:hypothetical protein
MVDLLGVQAYYCFIKFCVIVSIPTYRRRKHSSQHVIIAVLAAYHFAIPGANFGAGDGVDIFVHGSGSLILF